MTQNIPEGGWPTIPVLAPYETPGVPQFEMGLLDPTDEAAVDELLAFYDEALIPQLACVQDGSTDPHPQKGWVMSPGSPRTVVTCRVDGELRGAWIVKEEQIFYPCATIEFIAAIFRALWVETIQHFDYVWGSTKNPIILEFAKKAEHVPRNWMDATVKHDRLEWRRP